MGLFGVLVAVSACIQINYIVCMAVVNSPNAFPLRKMGCLFAPTVCDQAEVCIDDGLFGNCQKRDTAEFDSYTYDPDRQKLRLLLSELSRLSDNEYTWHDPYTQCIARHILQSVRLNVIYDPRICEEEELIARKIDNLDEDIYNLIRKIVDEEQVPHEENSSVFDKDRKRGEFLNIHKFSTKPAIPQKNRGQGEEVLDDAYDELTKLSLSDLFLLREYLERLVSDDTPNETPYVADLTDIAPAMSPHYADLVTKLLQKQIMPKDLNDEDLHMASQLLGKMAKNINKKEIHDDVLLSPSISKPPSVQNSAVETLNTKANLPSREKTGQEMTEDSYLKQAEDLLKHELLNDISASDEGHSSYPDGDTSIIIGKESGEDGDTDVKLDKKTGIHMDPRLSQHISDLEPPFYEVTTVSPASTTAENNLNEVDFNYAYIDMKDNLDLQEAVLLVRTLEKIVGLSAGTLELDQVENNIVTLHVPSNVGDVTAQSVASAAVENKDELNKHLGLTVVSSGFGTKIARVKLEELSHHQRYFILTFVLCGTVAFILVSVVIIYLVRRHSRSKDKLARLNGNGEPIEASKDYQDLCRQRMQAKSSEKPEPINAASRISSVSESQVKSPSSRSSTSSWSEEPVVTNMDISTGHIVLSYMESHLKNKDRLEEEWQTLSAYEADPCSVHVARDTTNNRKNRFSDVLPYDHSRVVLTDASNITQSDYINASTITDHDPRNPAYIATQGPLPHTVADFWQMVWEQGSAVIVMLTRLSENGSSICHRYWPEEGSDLYHIYEVHLVSEHIWCEDYLVRSFYLKNVETNETRTVTQFHFVTWLDNKTVPSVKSLLDFRRKVNKSFRGRSCPVVVHCSDGSGRTGTYCLIDMVLNRLAKGAKEIDIAATLEHIRDQRTSMVKSKEQFEFSLACVAEEVHAILKALPQ